MERQAQALDEEEFPVIGNVPHPLMYGHERVTLRQESKKKIVSLVPDESYRMPLYYMYVDVFDRGVYRCQVDDFMCSAPTGCAASIIHGKTNA